MNIKKQIGNALLQILGVIVLMSILISSMARMAGDAHKQTKNSVTAQHFKLVSDAATTYIQDNWAAIQTNATSTAPVTITTAELTAANYLSSTFSGVNPFGQSLQVEILQPSSGNLETKIISLNGTTIPDAQVPDIAAKIGAIGGYTSTSNITTAQGAFGGWTAPLTNNTKPGAGHLVGGLYFNNGQLATDYLYRHSVSGHPELNAMYTPLNMRYQATENTSNSLCVVGDATTFGRIAADTVGAVLSCQNGVWKKQGSSYWKDPVANFAALPTTDLDGTVRITLDTNRGFQWDSITASWKALAVDQSGNLTMTGTMTAGKTQLNDVVTENTACASNGLVARDATGLILSCQSGFWESSKNYAASYYSLTNTYTTLLLSTWVGTHRICVMSALKIPSSGGASCQVEMDASQHYWIYLQNSGASADGSWCHAMCFD